MCRWRVHVKKGTESISFPVSISASVPNKSHPAEMSELVPAESGKAPAVGLMLVPSSESADRLPDRVLGLDRRPAHADPA